LRAELSSTASLHAYADDTQLYLHFRRNEMASSADQLERCVLDIGHWMSTNRLKLIADKTELLFASSGHCCAALKGSTLGVVNDYALYKSTHSVTRSLAQVWGKIDAWCIAR